MHALAEALLRGSGGKKGKSRGPGGWPVEGCLFCFFCCSSKCGPPRWFKKGFLGSLNIALLEVVIWVNCCLVHSWVGGKVLNN